MRKDIHIRWLIRRDLAAVLEIESSSFEFPWQEKTFIDTLRQRNCIGMVAEHECDVAGFMIYELRRTSISLLSIAVHPDYRRIGIGTALIAKLLTKLNHVRRNQIDVQVRETNLGAQLFLRDLGFRAVAVVSNYYDDSDEDAYLFNYEKASQQVVS